MSGDFGNKYDEGKRNSPSSTGPQTIGSDLDCGSDASDMDLEDDESSYASSANRSVGGGGGGTYGSSYGSHSSSGGSRRSEAKMSPPPSRAPSNFSGGRSSGGGGGGGGGSGGGRGLKGGFGAAVPARNHKRLSVAIGSSVELGSGDAPSYDVTESVFIKGTFVFLCLCFFFFSFFVFVVPPPCF